MPHASRLRRWLGRVPMSVAVVAALLSTACGVDPGVETTSASPIEANGDGSAVVTAPGTSVPEGDQVPPTTPPPTAPPTTSAEPVLLADIRLADVVDVGTGKPDRDHDAFVAVAISDIERWWAEQFPLVYGETWEPLAGGIYAGYPGRDDDLPGCGEPVTSYPDLNQFAAFYCAIGDFMIYDDGDNSLLTALADNFGAAVLGVVLSHEYGHAVQERIGALEEFIATIYTEQQADCFSGAWMGQASRGESPLLQLGDRDIRAGLIAMLEVRDPVGTNQFVDGGHGSAFDRVGAFQEGFVLGPARCAELLDAPLTLMPNEFQLQSDLDRRGNASYDCSDDPSPDCTPATIFLADDLNDFWKTYLDAGFPELTARAVDDLAAVTCTGAIDVAGDAVLCPTDGVVVYDEPGVLELYREFGDFTLGYFYGIAWAERAQQHEGSRLAGEARALLNDCYTGAWTGDITPDAQGRTPRQRDTDGDGFFDTGISSSPGDLDEAIRMAIIVGDPGSDADRIGSPFEKIAAFRVGVLGGLDACRAQYGG